MQLHYYGKERIARNWTQYQKQTKTATLRNSPYFGQVTSTALSEVRLYDVEW
jgi:hypothetical protein